MSREEAIEVIKQDIPCEHDADLIEALEMAIQALSQEPCTDVQERYEDLCEYFGDAKDILKSRKDFKAWLERVKWHIHKAEELYEKSEMIFNNLCSSCTNIGCEFQFGIVRTKCAFYMPPHIESDNCGNYVVTQPTVVKFEGTNMACMGGDEIMKEFEQEPMREFTEEESKAYSKALDKIYKPTGFNVFDEPCEDAISRQYIKQKLQEHHDFFVNAYGGFSNLPQNDKARVDEITNCIAEVVNAPSVTPKSDNKYRKEARRWKNKWLKSQKSETGHWILLDDCSNSGYYCSECRKKVVKEGWSGTVKKIKFCPNCGCRMEGSEE